MSQAGEPNVIRPRGWKRFGLLAVATTAALAALGGTVALVDFGRVRGAGGTPASAGRWVADYWWVFGAIAIWGLVALAVAHAVFRDGPLLRSVRFGWAMAGVVPPCVAAAVVWWAFLAAA